MVDEKTITQTLIRGSACFENTSKLLNIELLKIFVFTLIMPKF